MLERRALLSLALLLVSLGGGRSWAQEWGTNGLSVCGAECVGDGQRLATDGAGGVFVAWRERRDYPLTGDDVYLQRVTAAGQIAAGWPAGGLAVCAAPGDQYPVGVVPDGEGGLLVGWGDWGDYSDGLEVHVQRVQADGSRHPGWPPDGAPAIAAAAIRDFGGVVGDAAGGAYLSYQDIRNEGMPGGSDVYLQRIQADGTVPPGWSAGGVPVGAAPQDQSVHERSLVQDGAGGAVMAFGDARDRPDGDVYGQRVGAGGGSAWEPNGRLLVGGRTGHGLLASDGGVGFYLATRSRFGAFYSDSAYYVQRFSMNGTRAPGWAVEGKRFCGASGDRGGLRTAEDGLGGVLFAWGDFRGPNPSGVYVTRVLSDGSLAPGWLPDGNLVSDNQNGFAIPDDVIPDGLGGAYVCWEWSNFSNTYIDARVQHVTAVGLPDPLWPTFGATVAETHGQWAPRLVPDGRGGAIVVWEERDEQAGRMGIYAQHFSGDLPTPVALSMARATAGPHAVELMWVGPGAGVLRAEVLRREEGTVSTGLGPAVPEGTDRLTFVDRTVLPGRRYAYRLAYREGPAERRSGETWVEVPAAALALEGFRPNPSGRNAVMAFTLPAAGQVKLDVFDLGGRRVAGCDSGWMEPGPHLVSVGAYLQPGVYGIRLKASGRALAARGVVIP